MQAGPRPFPQHTRYLSRGKGPALAYIHSQKALLALDIGILEIDQDATAAFWTEAVRLATFAEEI